jgi:hypothetical protein
MSGFIKLKNKDFRCFQVRDRGYRENQAGIHNNRQMVNQELPQGVISGCGIIHIALMIIIHSGLAQLKLIPCRELHWE